VKIFLRLAICALAGSVLASPARAVLPSEQLADPVLEARARAISAELRCVVCQNQSIDDSDADLAHDLRVLLRQRLTAGDTDAQAKDFLVRRYGSYVLLKPPFEAETLLLWLGPLAVLALGGVAVGFYFHARQGGGQWAQAPLTPDEQARLDQLLKAEEPA
jgi:cytochrome c-type biogenesis protein CcmH